MRRSITSCSTDKLLIVPGSHATFGDVMNNNLVYLLVGALVVVVAVLGYALYQEQHKSGVSVEVGGKDVLHLQAK